MELLDLPLEIFQAIMKEYVAESGIIPAWRARLTCRSFAGSITDEVFGKQPVETYRQDRAHRDFLKKGLHLYLECRSSALYSAHDILPAIVRRSVDRFMSVTTNASRERRREYLRAVSMAVPTHTVNSAFRLVAWPTERMFRTYNADGDDQIALPLAVALCDADLVRKIHNTGVDIWKPTAAFGLPLRVAIDTENLDIINLVLKLSEQGHTTVPLGKQGSLLSKEIAHMYRKLAELRADIPAQNDHHLKTLIIWYLSHFGQPTVQVGEAIMGWSIEKKDIRLFERAINLGLTFPLKRVYGQGFITRIPSSTNQRRKFLNILLHQDEINGRQSHFDYENHSALLTCAISTNNIDLVRTVLDMGCDPDGVLQDPTRDRHREWPLREALRQGHINIIRLLLDRGADPEGCRSPGFTDRLPAGVFSLTVDSEVRELLANAIYAKIIREGPDGYTRSPNFNHYCREILDIIPRHLISKRFWDVVYR